jgi:hypothetical protein
MDVFIWHSFLEIEMFDFFLRVQTQWIQRYSTVNNQVASNRVLTQLFGKQKSYGIADFTNVNEVM